MSERRFEQPIGPSQHELEQEIKQKSVESRETLADLEKEKADDDLEESRSGRKIKGGTAQKKKVDIFVERHGEITKRKKRHSGRGVDSTHQIKEQDHGGSKYEQLQRELSDAGISDPSEWRNALDLETPLEGEEKNESLQPEKRDKIELRNFEEIFTYLEGGLRVPDQLKIEKFKNTKDSLERLQLLSNMSASEAAQSIREFGLTDGAYHYLSQRLDFYQKLIRGEAVKRYRTQEWDSKKGECVDVVREDPIDPSIASPETIRLGLLRDTLFAGMIGTPEMGIFKISKRQCEERKIPTTHFPLVKGYHSGIFEGQIGWAYPFLRKTFERARTVVQNQVKDQKTDEQETEHRAVMLASRWLTESMNYNPSGRGPESPYVSGNDEAIAWSRLGEQVKKQLRGMRQKIQSVDLHNIERFIGKSGVDKYDPERKRLFGQIKFLKESYEQDKKQEFTSRENQFAAEKQTRWQEREIERLTQKLEKSRKEIAEAELPEEEAFLQLESAEAKYNEKVARIRQEVVERVSYFQNRTTEQLLGDLEERQKLVETRHEKRKSLAQKALDLHFRFNHGRRVRRGEYEERPYAGVIDWINNAPFGTIKRVHRALQKGVSEQTAMMLALAEIHGGKEKGISRADLDVAAFARNLAKAGHGYQVAENFEKFDGISPDEHKPVVMELIKAGTGAQVVENLEKFSGITPQDHHDIVYECISNNSGYQVAQRFEKFTGINSDEHLNIAHALSEAGAGAAVIDNFEKFSGIPVGEHRRIVPEAIKGGGSYQVIQNLEKFRGISEKDHRDIVLEIIKSGGGYYLNNALDKFKGLEEGLIQVIKNGKYEAIPHVLEAGFTIEEITRFPYLISPLVTKK
jgi:hypothetical protein